MLKLSRTALLAPGLASLLTLAGCATSGSQTASLAPAPRLSTDKYPLTAQSMVKPVNLRITTNTLSPNQQTALNQVADHASWISGEPVDVEIVTAGDPNAVNAGRMVGDYLLAHDVDAGTLHQTSNPNQPADVVTVNMIYYRARTYDCNQSWENLAATASNASYNNFGCAIASNLAAQVADPRDLSQSAPATSTDVARKSTILQKYRNGEITATQSDSQSDGKISDAIK